MKNCGCHTEINRDGSGQLQRYLKALDPSYAPVDSRNIEDLLVFAKKYAAQIRFYDLPVADNANSGATDATKISWREFFRRDMAVVIASVALTEPESFKKEFNEIRDKIEEHPTADLFAALFRPITGMLKKIDHWYSVAIPENPLYNDLVLAINSDLRNQVRNIMGYKKQFNVVDPGVQLKIDFDNIENAELWGIGQPFNLDNSLYAGNTKEEKISFAALNVEDIFYSFYNFLLQVISESDKYLSFAINEYPGHQPHMALFITFLELFRIARDQMNGLTERMLNFYYREVLRLQEKPSIPDKAHIVFELAAEIAEYDIKQGTALSAGDDLSGKEQVYKTTEDFVVNQVKVAELKTIFIEKQFLYGDDVKEKGDQVIQAVYARPVANSLDGFGEKFTDPYPKWHTFGEGSPAINEPKNICDTINLVKKLSSKRNDLAQIGFAIASPQLLMEGGKRLVQIIFNDKVTFAVLKRMAEANEGRSFKIWFTGEKKWFKIDRMMSQEDRVDFETFLPFGIFNPDAKVDNSDVYEGKGSYYLDGNAFNIYLPISESAVIGYDPKLHTGFKYSTDLPVMQIQINGAIDLTASEYKSLSVAALSLRVKVGSINPPNSPANPKIATKFHFDGLNKLLLHTENGQQTVGKSFDPYSPYPAKGKSFYIGSSEIFNKSFNVENFSKKKDLIAITIKKTADNDSFGGSGPRINDKDVDYKIEVLTKRDWVKASILENPKGDFSQLALTRNVLTRAVVFNDDDNVKDISDIALPRLPIQPVTEWQPGTEKGFLRITNLKQTETKMEDRQSQASQLEMAEVYLSYESTLHFLDASVDKFYHVYPFGNVQVYSDNSGGYNLTSNAGLNKTVRKNSLPLIPGKEDDPLIVDAGMKLLPHFTYLGPYEQYNADAPKLTSETNSFSALKKIGSISVISKEVNSKRREQSDRLMLSASGLLDKLEGGANQYSALAQEEGMLQIGLENLKPLQTVSLLFQFAEGSAEDEDKTPPDINWSYLASNEWRPLKAENLIADGTSGFQTTGIVKISIPEEATNHNWMVTDGLTWLCASVTKDSNRIPQLVDVMTQATEVIFEDNQNDQSHFDKALPAGTISKLVATVPEVSKITQPFASFDGKHQEIGKEFYTRVSERLRHKHRAITPWDYEHLVLDRFPSIYKVKCISYTDPDCLCREPLPKKEATPPAPVDPGLKLNLNYLPLLTSFADDASLRRFETVIRSLENNPASSIKLSGHQDGTDISKDLNKKRMDMLVEKITIAGIVKERIRSNITGDGEKNLIEFEFVMPDQNINEKKFRLSYETNPDFDAASLASIGKIKGMLMAHKGLTALIISNAPDNNLVQARQMANKLTSELAVSGVNENRMTISISVSGDMKTIDVILSGEIVAVAHRDTCCGPQIAPGHVLLVPIANLKNRNAVNPLQPKTSRRTLLDIEAYLKKLSSPFVHVHAKNPVYEQVLVFFRVKFYPQYDIGYYIKELNNEIVHFLTPWAFDENADVKFGQKIYASSIINFIEERKYVDFITDFIMVICKDECCPQPKETKIDVGPDDILAMVTIAGDVTTGITGKITDKMTDKPLPGVTVTVGGTDASTVTNATGDFILKPVTQDNGTISFSLNGFKRASADILFNQDQELVFKKQNDTILNEWGLSKGQIEELCGCSGVDYLFEDETDMPGDIVARPSTARSILVSAPQHIIIPYKEPTHPSPCEKNALLQGKLSALLKTTTSTEKMAAPKPALKMATGNIIGKTVTDKIKKTGPVSKPGKKNTGKKTNK